MSTSSLVSLDDRLRIVDALAEYRNSYGSCWAAWTHLSCVYRSILDPKRYDTLSMRTDVDGLYALVNARDPRVAAPHLAVLRFCADWGYVSHANLARLARDIERMSLAVPVGGANHWEAIRLDLLRLHEHRPDVDRVSLTGTSVSGSVFEIELGTSFEFGSRADAFEVYDHPNHVPDH